MTVSDFTLRKRPTLRELSELNETDLVNKFVEDKTFRQAYYEEIVRRMRDDGYVDTYDWIVAPKNAQISQLRAKVAQLEKQLANPVVGEQEEIVDALLVKQPHEWAIDMIQSGWNGEGARDPDDATYWLNRAISDQTTWDKVNAYEFTRRDKVIAFWRAMLNFWDKWEYKRKKRTASSG